MDEFRTDVSPHGYTVRQECIAEWRVPHVGPGVTRVWLGFTLGELVVTCTLDEPGKYQRDSTTGNRADFDFIAPYFPREMWPKGSRDWFWDGCGAEGAIRSSPLINRVIYERAEEYAVEWLRPIFGDCEGVQIVSDPDDHDIYVKILDGEEGSGRFRNWITNCYVELGESAEDAEALAKVWLVAFSGVNSLAEFPRSAMGVEQRGRELRIRQIMERVRCDCDKEAKEEEGFRNDT